MIRIGLKTHYDLCTYISVCPAILVGDVVSVTKIFFHFDKPERIIHDEWGNMTSHKLTDHEFNLIKHPTSFEDHLMENDLLPTGESFPFVLTTKKDLGTFEAPKNKKTHSLESLNQATQKNTLSTIELNHRETNWKSDNEEPSLEHSDDLSSCLSSFTHDDDTTCYSTNISIYFDTSRLIK